MCCFIGKVEYVAATRIFAAHGAGSRQRLVYSMSIVADDVAMVLPIPVIAGSAENAVRFIDLTDSPKFFDDLDRLFPKPRPTARGIAGMEGMEAAGSREVLEVHRVGAWESSFVASPREFVRLDERFRMPDGFWSAFPVYEDWGFVVFQLRANSEVDTVINPMAFDFPTRAPGELFFPTVHVHDGEIHETAEYDHTLYAQPERELPRVVQLMPRDVLREGKSEPVVPAVAFRPDADTPRSGTAIPKFESERTFAVRSSESASNDERVQKLMRKGLLNAAPVWKQSIQGRFVNEDVWARPA